MNFILNETSCKMGFKGIASLSKDQNKGLDVGVRVKDRYKELDIELRG
jgi:hypothetical protein